MHAMFQEVREIERFQAVNVTFGVIQGHWQWCHSVGHIRFAISVPLQLCLYIALLTRYYHLFAKTYRGHVTLNTSLFGVVYRACSSTPAYRSEVQNTRFEAFSFTNSKDMIAAKFKKRVT